LDFREMVTASIPGSDVTPEDVKTAKVIWGCSALKMKGYTKRRNVKCLIQSVSKVPKEPIKLQHNVELAIDCFFVNKHVFSLPTALKYASRWWHTLSHIK
jgi:hypothetical protein